MLAHSFDKFYVVTKYILPSIGDLNFSTLNYDNTCAYLETKIVCNTESKKQARSNDILQEDWTFCALLQNIDKIILHHSS